MACSYLKDYFLTVYYFSKSFSDDQAVLVSQHCKFVGDTNLGGAVDIFQGREALQRPQQIRHGQSSAV